MGITDGAAGPEFGVGEIQGGTFAKEVRGLLRSDARGRRSVMIDGEITQ